MTLMKHASVLLATALAQRVLPVPGGPKSNTPLGGSIPRLTNFSGCKRGVSTTSLNFSICSLHPPTSL
uniref:Putative secreted protein n=1 Tax=Panstrongylus lignarius TaxID=156445 RepID=A0A224Y5C0_9HEMI